MAELILSSAAAAVAARFAPAGVRDAAVALARLAGGAAGRTIDQRLFEEPRRIVGPRLGDVHIQGASEGAGIPHLYGRARLAGVVIWAAQPREHLKTERVGGGKSGRGGTEVAHRRYTMSFAVGLCEGIATRVERIWANGAEVDRSRVAMRFYPGAEDQEVDPLIEAIEGAGAAPAYRGLSYVVFEDFPLEGGYLPQMSFEVVRASPAQAGDPPRLEDLARGVCLIPGAGEFAYATSVVRRAAGEGREEAENAHVGGARADLLFSLDQLETDLPQCRSVMLVVGWFGTDLRAGHCLVRPGVDAAQKATRPKSWRVAGLERGQAALISSANGSPAYGGTPSDDSVLEAIVELKRRGFKVGLYPFLFMDIPADNALAWSGGGAQPAYPWRGRIGVWPAADKTPVAADAVASFFGTAQATQFATAGGAVSFSGPTEWSFRRFILHYAALAKAAGGVDSFVIGSELVGLTTARSGPSTYPAVAQLKALAGEARALLGAAPIVTYAADWTEYSGHQPADGSGDVHHHLDPLWADPAISVVGVDWYPPLSDWRAGQSHADAALAEDGLDPDYLASRVEGGEAYDWFYADEAARAAQARTPISDGAYGKPWVFRRKDLRAWWASPHFDRPGGVEAASPTDWAPQSKPIWLVEVGCPAVDAGPNAPNLFIDPKSAESRYPPFSSGRRDDLAQRRALEAILRHWFAPGADNPISPLYHGPMLAADGAHLWAWDARPYPHFPALESVWADASAYHVGHWLNGRAGGAPLAAVVADVCARSGLSGADVSALPQTVVGFVVDTPTTARAALEPLMLAYGFDARAHGAGLSFQPLGAGAVTTLDLAGLVSAPETRRVDAEDVPSVLRLRFMDAARDYRMALVERAVAGGAGGPMALDAPIVLDQGLAEAMAEDAAARLAAARLGETVTVGDAAAALEPGDRVRLEAGGAVRRVARIEDAGARRISLAPDPDRATLGRAGAGLVAAAAVMAPAPALAILDLPPLPWAEADDRPLAAVFASPWTGAHAVWAGPEAASASVRGEAAAPAVMGRLIWDLWPGPVGRWDEGNITRVKFFGPAALSSGTKRQILDGANAFAVALPGGGWELIQAREVRLVGQDTFELSGLLRGLQGSAPAPGERALAGALVVVLDERLARLDMRSPERGAALTFAAAPLGFLPSAPEATVVAGEVWAPVWARPFAPAHLRLVRAGGDDLRLSWVRRARIGGDPWGEAEPPLGEERERYRVEVLAGGAVKRSVEVDGPAFDYSAADQTADFGAPVTSFTARVAQLAAGWGVGARAESVVWV